MQNGSWTGSQSTVAGAFEAPPAEPIDREQVMKRLELIARLLDDALVLPGTRITLGWDAIIGLMPVAGDALTTLLSSYLVWEARRLGVSKWTLARMAANVGVDFLLGAVPVLGDLLDIGWKANRRNVNLLREVLRLEASQVARPVHHLHPLGENSFR